MLDDRPFAELMEVDELSQAMLGPLDMLNEFAKLGYFFQCSLGFLEQSFITGGVTPELSAILAQDFLVYHSVCLEGGVY